MQKLQQFGEPEIVGSITLGLMTWPDIDIQIMNEGTKDSLSYLIQQLWNQSGIIALDIFDNRNLDRAIHPNGFYIGLKFRGVISNPVWKIDIWFINPNKPTAILSVNDIKSKLTPEKRLIILKIKNILASNPGYRKKFYSVDIYNAVLDNNVTDLEGFRQFMKQKGIEF